MTNKELSLFIGKCLTIDYNQENRLYVAEHIKNEKVDWEKFVVFSSNYLITIETVNDNDEMLIEVELSDLFTDDYSTLQRLAKDITRQLKDELLLTPHLKLVAKGSLPVQEGKAVRVKDLRKLS